MDLTLPQFPAIWIETLAKPSWDAYFMSMVFLAAMRSPDQETKQGCVLVDWDTKTILGTGYNGHPRGAVDYCDNPFSGMCYPNAEQLKRFQDGGVEGIHILPTKRPDKYPFMVHADSNAAVNCRGTSNNAICYLPMPPCEVCLGIMANLPTVRIKRIVYLEDRNFPNTVALAKHLPHITFEKYKGQHPAEVLINAATYAMLRTSQGAELSKNSTTTYTGVKP